MKQILARLALIGLVSIYASYATAAGQHALAGADTHHQLAGDDAHNELTAADKHHQQHGQATEQDHDEHDHQAALNEELQREQHNLHAGDNDQVEADERTSDEQSSENLTGENTHDEHPHGERQHDEVAGEAEAHEAHEEGITLTTRQMQLANIRVAAVTARRMNDQLYAPAEVKANGYKSYLVSPRVDSIVVRRHVALGEHVTQGRELVTLFSETMAEAQAAYRVSVAEWQRVKKLGRNTVGEQRYLLAQTRFTSARGRLRAFTGLGEEAIASFLTATQPLGEYSLTADIDGVVLSDEFNQGQRVAAGHVLMQLADEKTLWVEARLAPDLQLTLPEGSAAKVTVGNEMFDAYVAQQAHTIDPVTRTRVVRLLVNNASHRLHPGMFADVTFDFSSAEPVLAVPETALMRGADGDWTLYEEDHPGEFKARKVVLKRSFGQWHEIAGVKPGTRVVMEGAFFVASQIAKGGFDPHNH